MNAPAGIVMRASYKGVRIRGACITSGSVCGFTPMIHGIIGAPNPVAGFLIIRAFIKRVSIR
jgi:hypothetical protein